MAADYGGEFEDFAVETHEWLSLAALASPRIGPSDNIDPFLSRYNPPGPTTTEKLVKVVWQGFISPSWAHRTLVQALLIVPKNGWFAYSVASFGEDWSEESRNSTILKVPDAPNEYVLWEVSQQ